MAFLEGSGRFAVGGVVGRPLGLVPAQDGVELGGKIGAQPVALGDEVGNRCGRVGEDQRAETRRLGERNLLGEVAAPGLPQQVVVAYPSRVASRFRSSLTKSSIVQKSLPRPWMWLLLPLPSWS